MKACDLSVYKEIIFVKRVGSVDRLDTITLESVDTDDGSFRYQGKRYTLGAFSSWIYVASYRKDADYIRFFEHIGSYFKEIEKERIIKECESLIEGVRVNLSVKTPSLYSVHSLLSTAVEVLGRNPNAYKANQQRTIYEAHDDHRDDR